MSAIHLSRETSAVLLGVRGLAEAQARNDFRLSSGMKVSSAIDDAPAFFKAQQMRGDIEDIGNAGLGITLAQSDISLAVTRGQAIVKLLVQVQAVAQTIDAITDDDRQHKLLDDMRELVHQIDGLSNQPEPDHINLLTGDNVTVNLNGQGRSAALGLDIGLTVKTLGLSFLLDQPQSSDATVEIRTAPATRVPATSGNVDDPLFHPPALTGAPRVRPASSGASAGASLAGAGGASSGAGGASLALATALSGPPSSDNDPQLLPFLPMPVAGNGINTGSVQATANVAAGTTAGQTSDVREVVAGPKWGAGAVGSGVALTYSFHTAASVYAAPGSYSGAPEAPYTTASDPPAALQTAVRNALQSWANVANITFTEVVDDATTAGDLRFGVSGAPATSYAFYPSGGATGGDVWFGNGAAGDYTTADATNTAAYTYFYNTAIHEIGHALGLKHPHDADVFGGNNFGGGAHDSIQYTVMSYRNIVGEAIVGYRSVDTSGAFYLPATPQTADVAALQYLYGANTTFAAGNTTYSYTEGQHVYETIYDAGGNDTIDATAVTSSTNIDLRPGGYSDVGAARVVDVNNHASVLNSTNLGIAFGVTIENLLLGSGNDTVSGNDAGDSLSLGGGGDSALGGAGADTVTGAAGSDTIDGGAGTDTAVFSGNLAQYSFAYSGNGNDIQVTGPDGSDLLRNVEFFQFADQTVAVPSGITISGTAGLTGRPILYVPSKELIQSAIARARSAVAKLGTLQDQLVSRGEFNKLREQLFSVAVDKLVLADLDEEGAFAAAINVRLSMATTALAIVTRQNAQLLRMFS